MDAKNAVPRVASDFCAIVPKESSMGYDKSGHHQLRETWKQRPKLHGEDLIRYDPICRRRNYLRTGDGAWNAAFLSISCECSVHLCWINNIWWRNTLTLIPSQPFHSSRTAAETKTCTALLMPAWYGLMFSSSWLQLFITFPLAACEIWISACLTDIQLPGHRWSTKANSLAKGIITYAKNTWILGVFLVMLIYNSRGAYDDHEAYWSSIFQSFCQIFHRMEGTWRSK